MREAAGPAGAAGQRERGAEAARRSLREGPGRLLVTLYGVFTVGAASRSAYQLSTKFHEAPLAYLLSALAALVYAFITLSLVRGGRTARRVAMVCCAAELTGVLTVGTWTLLDPSAFPDATVWSDYGLGYVFFPVVLPVTGLLWLRRSRMEHGPAAPAASPR
ncbi:hypothetical protein D7294_25055 [Streptomyces hoynatensis]|uniref:Integral membrane protein n=1 Tax=Streptomyces hoynatensis TaxID=1141874 RepID=A0A3A9YQ33_9ACTN|nr:hypothetical protein D7294_25055 [Streptomyces hoynatensis]